MRDDSASGGDESETDAAWIYKFSALCVGFADCVVRDSG